MIDKLYQIATMPPEQRVKKEVKSSEMAGKGFEQQREDLGFKKGGNVNMEYAKKEKRQQAFEDRQKKNRAKGKLKAIEFGKKLKRITQKPKDITDQFFGFIEQSGKSLFDEVMEKKPISKKEGGFIAKGCGKIMSNRRKKTKVY